MARLGRRIINQHAKSLGCDIHTRTEVRAPGAIPDLVLYHKRRRKIDYVISIEFKIRDWQCAMKQAYRHRNFANEVYVVLEYRKSAPARAAVEKFRSVNVGLATVDPDRGFQVWHYPVPSLPFSESFSKLFVKRLLARKTTPSMLPFTSSVRGGTKLHVLKNVLRFATPDEETRVGEPPVAA